MDDIFLAGCDRAYHRSRPGEIVRRMRAARTHGSEMLFVLDEVDKCLPIRGAVPVLLALLDPTQNRAFQDHYLDDVRLDLSEVLFVATANCREDIPGPLLDRLRVITLPRYTADQQIAIGRSHILPRLLERLRAA